MTKHEWRERNEEGEQVYYRAQHHAGRWEFFVTKKSDPEWEQVEGFSLEVMERFREVLWNKHLRRRVPLKHVEQVDAMIEGMRVDSEESDIGS